MAQQEDFARMRERVGGWKTDVQTDFVPTTDEFMPPVSTSANGGGDTRVDAKPADTAKDVYDQHPRGGSGKPPSSPQAPQKPQRIPRPQGKDLASTGAAGTNNETVTSASPPTPSVNPETGQFYQGGPTLGGSTANGQLGTATFGGTQPISTTGGPVTGGSGGSGGPAFGGGPTGGTQPGTQPGDQPPGGNPSNLPYDLSVEENPGTVWGGDKPDYITNMPKDMPTATHWEVTEDQTVAGQMRSLLETDNPVFMALREQMMRAHAASGGKNSLMASRAAVKAMTDMAFQIGSQDAATLAKSAEFNAAMDNQFGLAQQQFMHNAMLSEQNFRQGVMIVREQNKARLSEIDMEINGQLAAIGAQASAAGALENQRQQNTLEIMDRGHGQNLERDELNFQHNWMMAEQGQAHSLERNDRETDNTIRAGSANFGWQMQLQYLSETGANGRALLETVAAIASNPNIKGPQMQGAIRDVTHNYNQLGNALSSAYANAGLNQGGNVPGAAQGRAKDDGTQAADPYSSPYGNYMSYSNPMFGPGRGYSMGQGGYNMTAAPTAQFWGGTGVSARPMYGSNTAYANQTRPSNPGVGYGASGGTAPTGPTKAPAVEVPGSTGGGTPGGPPDNEQYNGPSQAKYPGP